jgi:hypothetical protein
LRPINVRRKSTCGKVFTQRVSDLAQDIPSDGITLKEFLDHIGEGGQLFSCMILTAPFLLPVSIPGSSIPFGLAILLLSIAMIIDKNIFLPKRVTSYKISQENVIGLLNGIVRILKRIEKFIKPRLTIFCSGKRIDQINGILIAICSILLMLPLPVPLTDFLPAYAILFLALGSLECDGYLVMAGYVMTIITTGYFLVTGIIGMDIIVSVLSYLGINV